MTDPFDFRRAYRLEADEAGDLAQGFRAAIGDPMWFLGAQWAIGEHQGDDGGTPVVATFRQSVEPMDSLDEDRLLDPQTLPVEAIIEGEPDDWWSPGRRVRASRRVSSSVGSSRALERNRLPQPYAQFHDSVRAIDGLSPAGGPEWRLGDAPLPATSGRAWQSARLSFRAELSAGGHRLVAKDHRGGEVDWWTVDAEASNAGPAAITSEPIERMPHRMSYPGAPLPRWWQLEDHRVDLGGFPPDRTHLGTLLLIDMVTTHADDWFTVPLAAPIGSIVTIEELAVTDAFDDVSPGLAPQGWSIFRTTGLDSNQLVLFPTAVTALRGETLDRVELAMDEDANVGWAVVGVAEGLPLEDSEIELGGPDLSGATLEAGGAMAYRYVPTRGMRRHWWPYLLQTIDGRQQWVQARFDPDIVGHAVPDRPESDLIDDRRQSEQEPVHTLDVDVLPETGIVIERRYVLARAVDGSPILWRERRREWLREGRPSGIRFDVAEASILGPQ